MEDVEKVSPEIFKRKVKQVIANGGHYQVNLSLKQSYDEYDCYLSCDKLQGFAVCKATGELINVFSLVKGHGEEVVNAAIDRYDTLTLNCFDGFLKSLYSRCGFVEVGREQNWDPSGPDVIWMEYQYNRVKS